MQPFQGENTALNAPKFPQRQSQAVLTGIRSQLSENQGGSDGPFVKRAGETQEVVPVALNVLDVDHPTQQRCQVGIGLWFVNGKDEVLAQVEVGLVHKRANPWVV